MPVWKLRRNNFLNRTRTWQKMKSYWAFPMLKGINISTSSSIMAIICMKILSKTIKTLVNSKRDFMYLLRSLLLNISQKRMPMMTWKTIKHIKANTCKTIAPPSLHQRFLSVIFKFLIHPNYEKSAAMSTVSTTDMTKSKSSGLMTAVHKTKGSWQRLVWIQLIFSRQRRVKLNHITLVRIMPMIWAVAFQATLLEATKKLTIRYRLKPFSNFIVRIRLWATMEETVITKASTKTLSRQCKHFRSTVREPLAISTHQTTQISLYPILTIEMTKSMWKLMIKDFLVALKKVNSLEFCQDTNVSWTKPISCNVAIKIPLVLATSHN